MKGNEQISQLQLTILMVGFLFGDAIILSVGKSHFQDAWLVSLVGWFLGSMLIGLYVLVAYLYPGHNLIQILKKAFGRYLGTLIGLLYAWYFIHIAALVIRSFSDYMVFVNYTETPRIFISIFNMSVMVLVLRAGITSVARSSTIVFPMVPINIIIVSCFLVKLFDFSNLQPVLERGMIAVGKGSWKVATYPYGEAIAFLMIFPYLSHYKRIGRVALLSATFAGFGLTIITLRNLLVLGPQMLFRATFPSHVITSLIPGAVTDPLIAVSLVIVTGIQVYIALLAAALSIQELFGLEDYQPIVIPLVALAVSLSNLLYTNLPEVVRVAGEIYPYYALPYQLFIPLLIVVVTLIKVLVIKGYHKFAKPSH